MKYSLDIYPDHTLRAGSWDELAEQLYQIKLKRKRVEQVESELQKKLIDLSQEKNSRSHNYVFSKIERSGSVNYKKIVIDLLPDVDTQEYKNASTYMWKLLKI